MTRRFAICSILLGGLAVATASAETRIVSQKLADGIWAAPTPGGANVGWFLMGEDVVAVDSGAGDEAGRAIVEEIKKTAGKRPRYLIVTHAHRDHAGGAAAFAAAGAQIVSAEQAAPGVLFVLGSASKAAGAAASVKKTSASAARNPVVLTVSERILFVGGPRRAEIYYLGPAHTRGDLVVVLPDDGVLFAGDLAGNGVLPFLRSADVDPKGWEQTLPRLAALKFDKMIPGHGRIGPREGISDTLAYIHRVNEIAARIVLAEVPEAFLEAQVHAPENQIENLPITPDHVANVKAVCQFLKTEREKGEREKGSSRPTPTPAAK